MTVSHQQPKVPEVPLPWGYAHRTTITMQHGEDGVARAIFDPFGITHRWCVELGAHDGSLLSNAWHWTFQEQWSGLLVEANEQPYEVLAMRYRGRPTGCCRQAYVSTSRPLDDLLADAGVSEKCALLSIDIDGMDYHLRASMTRYRPRVVSIKANASLGSELLFVQADPHQRRGSSALAPVERARSTGDELAAHLVSNCVFVRQDLFVSLTIEDNARETLFASSVVPKGVSDLDGSAMSSRKDRGASRRWCMAVCGPSSKTDPLRRCAS